MSLVCGTCMGRGTVVDNVRPCSHSGRCECGVEQIESACTVCNGTGDILCDNCGDFSGAERIGHDLLCGVCAAERKGRMAA